MTPLVAITAKVSAVVLLALAVVALARGRSAAWRHWILAASLVCAAAVPAVTRIVPSWSVALPAPAAPLDAVTADVSFTAMAPARVTPLGPANPSRPQPPSAVDLRSLLIGLWAVGAGAAVLWLAIGFGRLRVLSLGARAVTRTAWTDLLAAAAARERVTRPVRLLETDHPTLVVTWGSRMPVILLPCAAASWPADRLRIVLRHELAHIRRGDWTVQILAEIVRAVYWFNPLVWIACARLRQESERACDDAVIGGGVDPAEYAGHLVALARTLTARRHQWLPAQGIAKPSRLEKRISAMLDTRVNRSPLSPGSRAAAAAAALAFSAAVAGLGASAQGTVLSGTVVDAIGRPLTGQTVTLGTPPSEHEATTDSLGRFSFAALPPGDYVLRTVRSGFAPFEEEVTLSGERVDHAITLQLGSVEESIRVTDAPPPAPPAPRAAPGQTAAPAARPAPPTLEERIARVRAKRANDPCMQSPDGGCLMPPLKLKDVKPIFPDSLKGTSGFVVLKGTIAADGSVRGLQVVSSTHADLSSAALAAVKEWRFEPTLLDGVAVDTPMNVRLTFAATR